MMLDFQQKSLFEHLRSGLKLLKVTSCVIVERTHSAIEQRYV